MAYTWPLVIVDFHTHIFPPAMIRRRDSLAREDGWFAEMYSDPGARMATAEELVAEMDRCGVDRAAASGFAFRSLALCAEANDYVADAVKRFPERIYGSTVVPPLDPGAMDELERCLGLGFKGIGELLPDGQGFEPDDIAGLKRLAEWATAKEQPLLLHASEPLGRTYPGKGRATPDKCYRLACAYPDLKLVLAHWGGGLPFFEMLAGEGEALANVYYDCAASPYLYRPEIFRAVISLAGSGKILFGTDYPLMPQDRYIGEIGSLKLDAGDYSAIVGNNALELLEVP